MQAEPGSSPTILDVAERAGVSRQTVSNVLNAPDRVRPETRRRVDRAIAELGYRPHHFARNLKIQAARLLGYCVPAASRSSINPVMDRFLHALSAAARAHGYHVLLFTTDDDSDELETYGELIAARAVDGFVVSETNYRDRRVAHLRERRVPFCAFGRTGAGARDTARDSAATRDAATRDAAAGAQAPADDWVDVDWVDVDGAHGTCAVVAHLVQRGHRRIAHVGWPEGSVSGDERFRGYLEGLAAAGITARAEYDVRGTHAVDTGARACARLLDLPEPPTAVVAASDLLACGLLREANARGLTVGRDLAVAGFDDTPVAPFLSPPLTSLRQPLEAVAAAVVAALTGRLAQPDAPVTQVLLPPELIVREST